MGKSRRSNWGEGEGGGEERSVWKEEAVTGLQKTERHVSTGIEYDLSSSRPRWPGRKLPDEKYWTT